MYRRDMFNNFRQFPDSVITSESIANAVAKPQPSRAIIPCRAVERAPFVRVRAPNDDWDYRP